MSCILLNKMKTEKLTNRYLLGQYSKSMALSKVGKKKSDARMRRMGWTWDIAMNLQSSFKSFFFFQVCSTCYASSMQDFYFIIYKISGWDHKWHDSLGPDLHKLYSYYIKPPHVIIHEKLKILVCINVNYLLPYLPNFFIHNHVDSSRRDRAVFKLFFLWQNHIFFL